MKNIYKLLQKAVEVADLRKKETLSLISAGEKAEWLGSVAWDGYEWAEKKESRSAIAKTEEEFREAVKELEERECFTRPV